MKQLIENKKVLLANIKTLEDLVLDSSEEHAKIESVDNEDSKAISIINFKDKDIGYVTSVVEVNGVLSYMYLPFYEVGQNPRISDADVVYMCNEVNKSLSPARLVLNNNEVFGLCTHQFNISQMKKDGIRSLLKTFSKSIQMAVLQFKTIEKLRAEENKKTSSKLLKNNIEGDKK